MSSPNPHLISNTTTSISWRFTAKEFKSSPNHFNHTVFDNDRFIRSYVRLFTKTIHFATATRTLLRSLYWPNMPTSGQKRCSWINTLQIERSLKNDSEIKGVFWSVCALDQLEKLTFPSTYAINSDPSREPGEHLVSVYFDKRGRGEYFDSYGLSPSFVSLKSYMDFYSLLGWIYNRKTLQVVAVTIAFILSYFVAFYCIWFYIKPCWKRSFYLSFY